MNRMYLLDRAELLDALFAVNFYLERKMLREDLDISRQLFVLMRFEKE